MLSKFLKKDHFSSLDDFNNNYEVIIPENFNFAYDVADELARTAPNKKALVWCNDKGEEKVFTYSQIKYYSDKTANYLASLGIKKGDAVMLILKRRYEFWFCILALHKLGAIAVPATHLLTPKDLVYRNNAASIKAVIAVAEDEVMEHIDKAHIDSPTLQLKIGIGDNIHGDWHNFNMEMGKASPDFVRPTGDMATKNSDISLLYFTSGTTGQPKMVQHNFTYPLGHIITAKYWQNVKKDGLHLTVADTGWAKAVWGKLYGQWICECAVFVYDFDRFNPQELLEVISNHNITSFCAPPTIYRFLIKEDLTRYDLSSLEYCVVAGEPLNPEVYSQFYNATGIKLMEGYGQTELTVAIANLPGMEPKPGSMGKPVPGYDIDILNENGEPCDVGEEGQIVVYTNKKKPIGMFDGYYRDTKKTKNVWHDGIYYTGDMAWKDEDGYYWYVGRADDVIKSSGYRIGPFEVESALLEHPAVLECAITGVPHPIRGQVVKATIVLSKGYKPSEELKKELQDHVKKVTAPYKYPRIIEFVDELPKTISGKIRRVEIRKKDTQ
ncbi:MAG TPA: AMP-binding protein [Clostridiales bacterium]|nr:AMP-binding protein [Clostridiales bacterium]